MGKGNRSRIERAMNDSAKATKNVQANKKKVSGAGIFVSIAALLVVAALLIGAIGVLNDGGWFARSRTAVKTEHFEVNGSMMKYFFKTQFNNYYEYYYQMWSSYFQSSYSSAYALMEIDPNKSLKDQYMKVAEGEEPKTVFDHYMGLTEDYVTRMLTYCEFALKNGIELTEEDHHDIEHSIEEMENSYKSQKAMYEGLGLQYPYASFSAFLADQYGSGVNKSDIRKCLELTTLAAKFEEVKTEELKKLLDKEEGHKTIEDYVLANPATFLMADYYSYSFTVNDKNKTKEEFDKEVAELRKKAEELSKLEGKEAFKEAVLKLIEEEEYKTYHSKNWSEFLKNNDNDSTLAEEALKKDFAEKKWTESYQNEKFEKLLTEGYKHPATHTDLSKWVFGFDAGEHSDECDHEGEHEKSNDPAKKGDLTMIESETTKKENVSSTSGTTAGTTSAPETSAPETTVPETTAPETTEGVAPAAETTASGTTAGETTTKAPGSSTTQQVDVKTYTFTVYLLEKETYRNEDVTKHFGYVMFEDKATAEKFLAEFEKCETKNTEALLEVVEKLHEEIKVSGGQVYENYVIGDLKEQKIDGADTWLEKAEAGTHSGIVELVQTTTVTNTDKKQEEKKTTYYAVLVFDGNGSAFRHSDAYWYWEALQGATTEAVSEWYEENAIKTEYNNKAYRYIDLF